MKYNDKLLEFQEKLRVEEEITLRMKNVKKQLEFAKRRRCKEKTETIFPLCRKILGSPKAQAHELTYLWIIIL